MKKATSIVTMLILCFSLFVPVEALTRSEIPALARSNAKNLETRIKNSVSSSYTYGGYRGVVLDDWAVKEVSMADELGILPDTVGDYFHEPITRANFASLCVSAIRVLSNSSENELASNLSPGQFQDIEIGICSEFGIMQGSNGNFYPDRTITRQEAAAMLSRMATLFGYTPSANSLSFKDTKGLWGESDISKVSAMTMPYLPGNSRVMGGMGNSKFEPQDIYSRQQAVASMVRLVGAIVGNYNGIKPTPATPTSDPTPTFKLPEDKTGFTPYSYSWELTGYDAQDIDGVHFRNGKYVRSDGMAVIYLDHTSSPDYFSYYLCVVNKNGTELGQAYDAEYISDKVAEDKVLFNKFTAGVKNGVNCIDVYVTRKDEYFEPTLNPEGTYYLVRAKNK